LLWCDDICARWQRAAMMSRKAARAKSTSALWAQRSNSATRALPGIASLRLQRRTLGVSFTEFWYSPSLSRY